MKTKISLASLLCIPILASCSLMNTIMGNIETPKYNIISSQDSIEVRLYEPMNIATVNVPGSRKESIKKGFRMLADYIFGNNHIHKDIQMTAPVKQQSSKEITMTAPVQQQQKGDVWQISFVMPSKYKIDELPIPNNKAVQIIEIPEQQFIAIQFSGTNSDENIDEHKELLSKYVKEKGINITGSYKYAFYNHPWTLPFMRRNEVLIRASN